jgi:hypothetical protein
MSFAQGFAVPAGFVNGRQCDPQPLTQEESVASVGGEMVVQAAASEALEDDGDSDASSDSMASCPVRGPSRYKKTFKETTRGIFKVRDCVDGMDHGDFVQRVSELRGIGVVHEVDDDSLFLHVICNQYAAACGLDNGKKWEDWIEMRDHYDAGTLPRFRAAKQRQKKAKHWHFESVEQPVESCYTMRNFLDSHGLGSHDKLHERMEAAAVLSVRNRGLPEPAVLPRHDSLGFVVHRFDPADVAAFEALLPVVMKEQLRDDAHRRFADDRRSLPPPAAPGLAQVASRQVAAPQRARYSPTEEDLERDLDQDEKVTWNGNVLSKMNVHDIIESSLHRSKILSNLNRSQTVEEAVSQIAMKCGANYIRKPTVYKPQPEMNEEKRRVYTRAMLPSMFSCASEVLETYVYKFEK